MKDLRNVMLPVHNEELFVAVRCCHHWTGNGRHEWTGPFMASAIIYTNGKRTYIIFKCYKLIYTIEHMNNDF